MKPGYKTTEFYITLGTQLLALLALAGFVKPGDQAGLAEALTNAVTAVAAIAASYHTVRAYVQSRVDAKALDATTWRVGLPDGAP